MDLSLRPELSKKNDPVWERAEPLGGAEGPFLPFLFYKMCWMKFSFIKTGVGFTHQKDVSHIFYTGFSTNYIKNIMTGICTV